MSYHQSGLLLALVETYTDIFMKRSFRRMHSSLKPDAVLFLGDLNDGGRISHGYVFEKNKNRFFERIFQTRTTAWNQRPLVIDPTVTTEEGQPISEAHGDEENIAVSGYYQQLANVPLDAADREAMRNTGRSVRLYVAGNHDVGFGDTLIRSSMVRYKQVFGAVNYEINVGNHSLVVLDTLSLSSGIQDIREESHRFLAQMEKETPTLPRILFTHVPLFRLDTTYCGDARETEQLILNRKGEQYQNMVNATLSRQILHNVQPDMVFSGDDHDWCEIAHSLDGTLTPEVTLPTFSFAQGIQQPGFVMLSLYNPQHKVRNEFPMIPVDTGLPVSMDESAGSVARPTQDTTFAYEECMLPNQMLIYLCYGVLFACTLNSILAQRFWWMKSSRRHLEDRLTLARWRDSRSPHSSEAAPQGSTTATAISTQRQAQQQTLQEQQEQCEDDTVGGPSDAFLSEQDTVFNDSMAGCKLSKDIWPLQSSIYWKMVGWDLWNIARYAIPFYVLLFVVSII
ncbi:hypothetical protein BGZ58_006997 [Dissophora ornata]|nr:hypothetical protein BGZ58_006997 [Dissophora ornata]